MDSITIFTMPRCPRCEQLKQSISRTVPNFEVRNLMDPDAAADILFDTGERPMAAPVLKIGSDYYFSYQLFDEKGNLKTDIRSLAG